MTPAAYTLIVFAFKDFFKPGLWVSLLAFAVSLVILPILYPLYP